MITERQRGHNQKHYKRHKEELLEKKRGYYKNNKERIIERISLYNKNIKDGDENFHEKCKQESKDYYNTNRKKILKQKKDNFPNIKERVNNNAKKKYKKDPKMRINRSISSQIYQALKKSKAGRKWETLVGYTLQDLMAHLESLFKLGMTFENYGEWHIDHKKPRKLFNYKTAEDPEFKECWSLNNLQPLWKSENLIKGVKYEQQC